MLIRKFFLIIGLLVSLFASAQLPTIPGITNRNTREQVVEGRFYQRLSPPNDTTYSKYGFATLNGIAYWGDGARWYQYIVSNTTNLIAGDIAKYDINGNLYNEHPLPSSCNNGSNVPISYVTGLTYAYGSGPYSINCVGYTISTGGTLTLDDGDADPGEFRFDVIYLDDTGIHVHKGDNSSGGVGDIWQVDPASQIELLVVRIDEDNTAPTGPSATTVYDENAEWTTGTGGTITAAFNYGTNPENGSLSTRITAAANNAYFQYTNASTVSKSTFTNLQIWVRNNSVFNANRNIVVRLYNTNTQVGNSVNLTAWGYSKTLLNTWQLVSIPMSAFGGADAFNRVRFLNTGTGGTVNVQFDNIQLQGGVGGGGGSVTGFRNGLVESSGYGELGGTLIHDTYINGRNYVLTIDSANKIVFRMNSTDSAVNFTRLDGTPIFRIDGVTSTAYVFQFNAANGVFLVDGSAARVAGAHFLQFQTGASIQGYQQLTQFVRSYPSIGLPETQVALQLTNDNNGTAPTDDSTVYKPLSILFNSYDDHIEREKFFVNALGQLGFPLGLPIEASPDYVLAIKDGLSVYATYGGGGGGGTDSPDRINGTATANVNADMDIYALNIFGTNNISLTNVDSRVRVGSGFTSIRNSNVGELLFDENDNVIVLTDYRGTPKGIEYAADYSATFTNRSLVDKEYVDDAIAALGGGGYTGIRDTLGSSASGNGTRIIVDDANGVFKLQTSAAGGYPFINVASGILRLSGTGSGAGLVVWVGNNGFSEYIVLDGQSQTLGTGGGSPLNITNAAFNNATRFKNTSAPGSSPADLVQVYAEDVASSSELKVRDEAGNITTLSPHNFTGIPEGKSDPMAWAFYSERDGKYINVDMYKLAQLVEKITGKKLIYTGDINKKPNEKNN